MAAATRWCLLAGFFAMAYAQTPLYSEDQNSHLVAGVARVGVGVAKGIDVASAVSKAKLEGKKSMITIQLKDGRTIAHEVIAKYSAAKVLLKPTGLGRGLKAGGAVRFVLALAGVKDATGKCLGRTPNKLTNALATIEALKKLKSTKPESGTKQRMDA